MPGALRKSATSTVCRPWWGSERRRRATALTWRTLHHAGGGAKTAVHAKRPGVIETRPRRRMLQFPESRFFPKHRLFVKETTMERNKQLDGLIGLEKARA